jgi:hypothetical protein
VTVGGPQSTVTRSPAIVAWTATGAALAFVLLFNQPKDAFFSGDSGVKLIAAKNAIAHRARPFEIDLPRIAGQPVLWVERFFPIHGDHAHVVQSPIFPVIAAPLIAVLGLAGAYVLPAVSYALFPLLLNAVRRRLAPDLSPLLLGFFCVAASPLFFYALEFWEHVPAAAVLAGATACFANADGRRTSPDLWCGTLIGVAALLRPEAVWYGPGVAAAIGWRPSRLLVLFLGAAIGYLPFVIYNAVHFGSLFGPHIETSLGPVGVRWLHTRFERLDLWLALSSRITIVVALLFAASWLLRRVVVSRESALILALLGASLLAIAASLGYYRREALWTAWPVGGLLLVDVPREKAARSLLTIALVAIAGIWLTSAHDGGAQWGPRFLITVSPPLVLLTALVAQKAADPGPLRVLRVGMIAVMCICGVAITRSAYRELRGSKQLYAQLVSSAEQLIPAGSYVVTDVWWFDQVTAALYDRHTTLYAADSGKWHEMLAALQTANIREITMVVERNVGDPSTHFEGTCYRAMDVRELRNPDLTLLLARCDGL